MSNEKGEKKTRRPPGEGALYWSAAHNRYEAAITIDGIRITVTSSTRGTKAEKWKEASQKLQNIKNQAIRGARAGKSTQTFGEFIDDWNEEKRAGLKKSTYPTRKSRIETHIKPLLGNLQVQKIKRAQIVDFKEKLLKKRLKASTIRKIYDLVRMAFDAAVARGIIAASPCVDISLPRLEEEEMDILSNGERDTYFAWLKQEQHPFEALFVVALLTGMRSGELRALKWKDIDFDKRLISVTKSVEYIVREGYHEDTPKSKAGIRTIPLVEQAWDVLYAHRFHQKKCYLADGRSWNEEALVFQSQGKTYIAQCVIGKALKQTLKAAGLHIVRMHDLRHSAITSMLLAGMNIKSVMKVAGHSRVEMTLHYVRALPENIEEDMRRFGASVAAS